MITVSQLVGLVSISGADEGAAKLLGVGSAANSAKASMLTFAAGGAAILAAGLIALGVKASEMAGNFQQGVNRLRTGGGDIQDSFNTLSNGIKSVAVAAGTATKPLIDAMYLILSANQRGAQSFDTLKAAAQGAQIEQANLADVTKALTTLQTNWGINTYTATQYMNGLIKAVSGGKITLEELTKFMAPILPIAKQYGISLMDVAAAMSVQTNAGLKAAQSATGLQAVFVNIENPTSKASKAMKEFGVNSVAVADEMKKSLPGAFQMLMDAALKVGPIGSVAFNRAMADMVGGGTRTAKTIDALTQHMSDWTKGVAAIGDTMKSHSKDVDGWALAQSGFNIQMDKAKASMEMLGISIGQMLLPVLTKIVSAVTPIITGFTKWITTGDNAKTALAVVAGVLAGLAAIVLAVVVPALIAFVTTMWPILAVGLGVAAVVTGAILAFQHWGQIVTWLGNLWHTVSGWIGDRFSWLGSKVHGFISAWQIEFSYIGAQFSAFGSLVHGVISAIGGFFDGLGTKVHEFVTGVISWFQQLPGRLLQIGRDMVQGLINGFVSMGGALASAIGTTVHNAVGNIPGLGGLLQATHLFGYQEGGPVLQTGLALVHRGEYVIPAGGFPSGRSYGSSGGGVSGQPVVVQLKINGYQFISAVMPDFVRAVRNNTGVLM